MLTNQYLIEVRGMDTDAARLGAQVISGIGFLGAGTIIVVGHNQVKGLTTAAGLWSCACMGLAIGIGFYEGALICCIFLYGVLMGLHRLDNYVQHHSREIEIYLEAEDMRALSNFIEYIKSHGGRVANLEIHRIKEDNYQSVGAMMTLCMKERRDQLGYIFELDKIEGIRAIEELV